MNISTRFSKEKREVLTINFLIQMGTGEALAKDVALEMNESHIKYRMTKESNTYRFIFADVDFDVTQIRYENRMLKISVYNNTSEAKAIIEKIVSKARKYYLDSEENKAIYSLRQTRSFERKQILPDISFRREKVVCGITINESYKFISQKLKTVNKYMEWVSCSSKFNKGHLSFLGLLVQTIFSEKDKLLKEVYDTNIDIA